VHSYHSHMVLLAGIVVDDVACLLVAGASYPRVLTKTLGLDIANVELFLHVPLHHLIYHQKTACDRGAACE